MLFSDVIEILANVGNKQMAVSELREVLEELREYDGELSMRDIKLATAKKPPMIQTFCYKIFKARENEEPERLTDWQFKIVTGRTEKELFEKARKSAMRRAEDFGNDCFYDDFSWDEAREYVRED